MIRNPPPNSDTAASWAAHAAGGATPESLHAIATADPTALSGADLVDAITASEKALSLLTGLQMRFMAALAEPFVAGDPMRLATRIARKNSISRDDSPERTQLCVPEAAACLAAAEVAAALRISPVTAGIRVRDATTMTTALAPTLTALERGQIDRGKSRVIADHCHPLSPEHTTALQNIVLPEADQLTTSELRDLTGQAVIAIDPEGAEERHRAAAARRELTLRPQPDAMATLNAFLPADGAVKIFQISDLLATSTAGVPDDDRGIGARRIDALVDIADHLLTYGHLDLTHYIDHPLTDHSGPRTTEHADTASRNTDTPSPDDDSGPATQTPGGTAPSPAPADRATGTAPAPADQATGTGTGTGTDTDTGTGTGTGMGMGMGMGSEPDPPDQTTAPAETTKPANSTDRSRRALTRQGRRPHLSVTIGLDTLTGRNELPAHLSGFGAIPACLGRAIALSAGTVTALFADPATGNITDAGDLTYRPTQRLRDQIAALNATCEFPSCRQPVWRCDLDHHEPFNHQDPTEGGRTTTVNTGPHCRRHHLLKHHSDWRFRADPQNFTLHWTSPTGHHYTQTTRPALLPLLAVTTPSTILAERLDLLTVMAPTTTTPSSIEEHLTTLLLHRTPPPMEYELPDNYWLQPADDNSDPHPQPHTSDADLPDEPPF